MGLHYENLDDDTRRFMIEEIEMDIATDQIYLSTRLNQRAQGNWPDFMLEAARLGTDDTLALQLRSSNSLNNMETRRIPSGRIIDAKVPHNAAEVLAESEFNRYYARGLSRRALADGITRLQVYRAKSVANPRPESEAMIGLLCEPEVLLIDLRASTAGVDPALGIPSGPGSGITVRLPR